MRNDKESESEDVMKLFEEMELFEAYKFAKQGGQALHLFMDPGVYPGAPECFKKSRHAAHLFDQDKKRLVATARKLGVRIIKLGREGTEKQHVDLCGQPLQRAIALAEIADKTPLLINMQSRPDPKEARSCKFPAESEE